MNEANPMRSGQERFHWNAGGWFGGSIGGTAWMLPCGGIALLNGEVLVSVIVFGCFVATNLVAGYLWMSRETLPAFTGLMTLFATMAVSVPVAWLVVRYLASPKSLEQMNMPLSSIWTVIVVVSVPVIMLWFYLQHHSARGVIGKEEND